ncbi:MAG: hypothetical protein V4557_08535 [Bacteroidota bacterium]
MRKLLLLAFMPMACMLATKTMALPYFANDSAKVAHVTDGKLDEWKIEKFETDPVTKMQYSVDDDGENLYVALKITDQFVQGRIMAFGMNMFIDKKGKKKEGTSIEFPLKSTMGGFNRGGGANPREAREKKASMMIFLRAFGLDNIEDNKLYLISQPGMVNLDFSWDAADNMYIEYVVPFVYIGVTASLKDKPLSIGWKFREASAGTPGSEPSGTTTISSKTVAVPAGSPPPSTTTTSSRSGGGRSGGGRSGNSFGGLESSEPYVKETSIWTKYVLTF